MKTELAGITRANEGMQGISWNILGQTYVPKSCTEHSLLLARHVPARHLRAAAHPSRPGRISLHPRGQARLHARRRRRPRRRPATWSGWRWASRTASSTNPADREDAVLGVAEPPALRPVLGHSQHEGAEPRGRGGAGRRTQRALLAATAGSVIFAQLTSLLRRVGRAQRNHQHENWLYPSYAAAGLSCPAKAAHTVRRGFSIQSLTPLENGSPVKPGDDGGGDSTNLRCARK